MKGHDAVDFVAIADAAVAASVGAARAISRAGARRPKDSLVPNVERADMYRDLGAATEENAPDAFRKD